MLMSGEQVELVASRCGLSSETVPLHQRTCGAAAAALCRLELI